ncbi:hypothetical protein HOH51_03390 [bacterium]|nr:hypothetical protein [bacterium]
MSGQGNLPESFVASSQPSQSLYDILQPVVTTTESLSVDPKARAVIADIHADYDALVASLQAAVVIAQQEGLLIYELILLGDYIDRGVESFEVINSIVKLRKKIDSIENLDFKLTTLWGNHEACLFEAMCAPYSLGAVAGWLVQGGLQTLESLQQLRDVSINSDFFEALESRLLPDKLKQSRHNVARYLQDNKAAEDYLRIYLSELARHPIIRSFFNSLELYAFSGKDFYVHGGLTAEFIINNNIATDSWFDLSKKRFQAAVSEAWIGDFDDFKTFTAAPRSRGGSIEDIPGPLWTSSVDLPQDKFGRLVLADLLAIYGAKRMVVGHSVVNELSLVDLTASTKLPLEVLFLDTGISYVYRTNYSRQCLVTGDGFNYAISQDNSPFSF